VATLALALPGCGEQGTSASGDAVAPQPQAGTTTGSPRESCPRQLGAFVASLDALRSQLAVGLAYRQYVGRVKELRASYDAIPVDRLTLDCLTAAGTAGERALNEHVDAANAWGRCLADAACTTASIEPVLQRRWRIASHYLSEAQ